MKTKKIVALCALSITALAVLASSKRKPAFRHSYIPIAAPCSKNA